MAGKPPHPDDVGCPILIDDKNNVQHHVPTSPGKAKKNAPFYISCAEGSEGWYFDFMNLGSDGTLFAFINRTTRPHEVSWFWNR